MKKQNKVRGLLKRISRGFKILYQRFSNSTLVKNLQAEQESASKGELEDFMPRLLEFQPIRLNKYEKNPFATDFSSLPKINISLNKI